MPPFTQPSSTKTAHTKLVQKKKKQVEQRYNIKQIVSQTTEKSRCQWH
jgi:hypothetical protein